MDGSIEGVREAHLLGLNLAGAAAGSVSGVGERSDL